MNKHVKDFLLRGMAFGGFGPIIAGAVYLILSFTLQDFLIDGVQVFTAIITTYILAFVQAGASVFNDIESWSIAKSLLIHLATVYVAYVGCYLINSWIPFEWSVVLIFTVIFIAAYFLIWLTVYCIVKNTCKKLNAGL